MLQNPQRPAENSPSSQLPYSQRYLQCVLSLAMLLSWPGTRRAQAQSITAATDGTGTVVTQTDEQFTIEGGSLSGEGTNLFHSFKSFSLDAGETATFLAQPWVQNVLARVNGGSPSILNGLVQFSSEGGSQPNLFLMNPAGVLFGANARLNLPGNLTVTTADGMGFETGWFGATGENTYRTLTGEPTGEFGWLSEQPGSVVNEGTLSLRSGAALTLLGGTVVNTGTLSAPDGAITLAAVPETTEENLVRLNHSGSLLSLEWVATTSAPGTTIGFNAPALTPLDLPALLAHSEQTSATSLAVNPDGTVNLLGASEALGTQIPSAQTGSVLTAGTLNTSTQLNESETVLGTGSLGTGGEIAILGDRVGLFGATLSASGPSGGGNIRVGGDYQGQGPLLTASQTYADDRTTLRADALGAGDGGRVILWADETTQFSGQISARGGTSGGDGGFVEVSGQETLIFRGQVDTGATLGEVGSLLLDPENITITSGGNGPDDEQILDFNIFETDPGGLFTLSEETLEALAGNSQVTLEASDNIFIEDLADGVLDFANGTGSITFLADADGDGIGDIEMDDPGDVLNAPGRSLDFSGVNLFLGDLDTAALQGGEISLEASDTVMTGTLNTGAFFGDGGDITILADGEIETASIFTGGRMLGGNVTLISPTGDIDTGEIITTDGSGLEGTTELFAPQGDVFVDGSLLSSASVEEEEDYFFEDEDGIFEDNAFSEIENFFGEEDLLDTGDFEDIFEDDFEDTFEEDTFEDGFEDEGFEDDLEDSYEDDLEGSEGEFEDDYEGEDSDEYGDEESDEYEDEYGDEYEDELDDIGLYDWEIDLLEETEAGEEIQKFEKKSSEDFSTYLGRDLEGEDLTPEEVKQLLGDIESKTQNRSAVVYIKTPSLSARAATSQTKSDDSVSEGLEILVFSSNQPPLKITTSDVNPTQLLETITQFRSRLITSARRGGTGYLPPAQRLYQWLIAPLEEALGPDAIDTLVFSMGEGLRSLPVAALHDGEQFLVEKYSLGVVPALSLIDTQYEALGDAEVLAMGVSDFESLAPLPAVPYEVDLINQLWPGSAFLNENFTRETLVEERQNSPYRVIHLATHAEFKPGTSDDSYIQLWDEKLLLSELDRLGWQYPAVDLLVLSACSTAVGSAEAEMGFAGLAVASGVRSAMASLWSVNDFGTLALMGEFYSQLKNKTVKVEALRAAQLAMLNGDLQTESGQLQLRSSFSTPGNLPPSGNIDLSHPYYWSGFTMIGSPW
ncbi:MAG: CHAT domain-containing protein [Cyanobacteria bacterium P01_F01_bin.53]